MGKKNEKSFRGGVRSGNEKDADTKVPNPKRAKKDADAIVSRGVAIQAELDERSDVISTTDRLNGLNSAIAIYEQALAVCPDHADSWYNLSVAMIERLECGQSSAEQKRSDLLWSLNALDDVIRRDTSGRAETTGLAHRAIGNAIREYLDETIAVKGLSELDIIASGTINFEASVRILMGSRDMDMYLLDYGRFLRFSLERFLRNESPYTFVEKLRRGRELALQATSVLNSCLQTECHGNLDLDVCLEATEVCTVLLQFVLAATGNELVTVPDEFHFCAVKIIENEKAINAVKDDDDKHADSILKDAYETLVKFFGALSDIPNYLKYSRALILQCERTIGGHGMAADIGDCMFCLGMTMQRSREIADYITAVSKDSGAITEDENSSNARSVLLFLNKYATSGQLSLISLPASPAIPDYLLYAAAGHYEAFVASAEEATRSEVRVDDSSSRDDILAVYFNLACIGWNMKHESFCVSMMSKYCEHLRLESGAQAYQGSVLDQLVMDVRNDPDMRGMAESEWFHNFIQRGRSCFVP